EPPDPTGARGTRSGDPRRRRPAIPPRSPSSIGKYPDPVGVLAESVGFFFVSGEGLVEEPLEEDGRVAAFRKLERQHHLAAAPVELVVPGGRRKTCGSHQRVPSTFAEERLLQLLEAELPLLDLLLPE